MILATWNVQGIARKLNEVIVELKNLKIDLTVVTETKKKGQGSEGLGEYDHFYSGVPKEERAKRGVGIIIHRKWRRCIKSWEAVNERIIKLNLQMFGEKITVLGVYGVDEGDPWTTKEEFYQKMSEEITKLGNTRELLILGDLNGRVGRKQNDPVIGKYGEDRRNNNGERLIALCEQNNLKIMNGFYQHKEIHKFTWTNETRGQKSIIDYTIAKQKSNLEIRDVKICRGPTCGSDHYLLKTKIWFPGGKQNNQNESKGKLASEETEDTKKYNLASLEDETARWLYRNRLDQKLSNNMTFTNLEEHYLHIKESIHNAALEALGRYENIATHNKPYWWDEEIEKDIEEKRKKYQIYLSSKKTEDKETYKKAQTKVRRKISQKKNESWEKKCIRLNTYLGGKRNTESWRTLRNLRSNRSKEIVTPITSQQWETYFQELLTEQRIEFKEEETQNIKTMGSPVRITKEEVKKQCGFLKNGRSPGPGEIYGELIKNGSSKLTDHLTKLFQTCINKKEVPMEWKTSYLTTIFKKGDRNKCENYRGIAVTSTLSRIYGKILKAKIENEYTDSEAEEQAGFRAGRSTVDHLFTITQVMEKKLGYNQELHLLFVDLKKAYDSIPLSKLWHALETSNINTELIKAVRSLYEDIKTKIKQGKNISKGFKTDKGLKQGCCLSPTLFKIYLEQAIKTWKRNSRGMGLPLEDYILYTLSFADDQVVIAQDYEDLEYMTRKLIEEYTKWGLEVNLSKTEYMCIGGEQRDLILNSGKTIKQCTEYKYLGMRLTNNGDLTEAIKDRNTQGRKAIALLNSVLWDKNISKENKTRIYNTIVKAITTYSSEVWPLKETTKKMLKATEMDYWRRAAGRSRMERIPNERIREVMKVKHTIVDDIQDKQLIWFGHVQRMPETRIPKQVMQWKPGGRRKRGRPRRSWREGVDEEVQKLRLEEGAWRDREGWRLGIGRRRTL